MLFLSPTELKRMDLRLFLLLETSGVFLLLTHFGLDSVAPPELFLSLCYSSVTISADTCLSCDARSPFLLADGGNQKQRISLRM